MFGFSKGLLSGGDSKNSNLVKINTLIGEGTVINGDVELTTSIKVDGIVNGNITTTADVIVEESATVYGEISAECVLVSGTVEGNIYAHDQLTISSTAHVRGDVITPGFVVDVGSEFTGKCDIIEREVMKKAEFIVDSANELVKRDSVVVNQAQGLKDAMQEVVPEEQKEAIVV